ncbi:MAG TPA: DUF5522 domain-containing protein [Acidobacteriaceae bacterium]|nr:DUF5522 domain-containing protein [Acidobacteriaceae bacterium]
MSESIPSAAEQKTAEPRPANSPIPSTPLEPEDFYYENGLMVFTAAYHRKRGYCCNSGCRHCPFR